MSSNFTIFPCKAQILFLRESIDEFDHDRHFFNGKIGLVVLLIKNIWDHYANLKKGTLPLNLVKKQYLKKEEGAGYIWSCMYLRFS